MKSVKELITVGKQYFENKEYARAEDHLSKVIEMGVRYADVYNILGVISHAQGKFASAIEYFQKSLDINPRYTEAILNLAVLYNDLGQYADAKKLYGSLKKQTTKTQAQIEPVLRGKLSNLHADIGDIYRSIGFHKFAIEEYKKALDLNPTYMDIRTKLGQALRENGKFNDSLKELKKVIRQNGAYSSALIQQGITFYALDKINDAKKSWQNALKCDSENKYAQMYLRLCKATAESRKTKAKAKRAEVKVKTKVKKKSKKKAKR